MQRGSSSSNGDLDAVIGLKFVSVLCTLLTFRLWAFAGQDAGCFICCSCFFSQLKERGKEDIEALRTLPFLLFHVGLGTLPKVAKASSKPAPSHLPPHHNNNTSLEII